MMRMIGFYVLALLGVTLVCCNARSGTRPLADGVQPLANPAPRSADHAPAPPLAHAEPHEAVPNPVVSAPSMPLTAMDEHTRPASVHEPLPATPLASTSMNPGAAPTIIHTPPPAQDMEDRTIPPLPENATAVVPRRGEAELPTAADQGEGVDLEITRAIRHTLMERKGLSTQARLVTVITRDRVVSLRGPVESAGERTKVIALAAETPQVQQVLSWLEVP